MTRRVSDLTAGDRWLAGPADMPLDMGRALCLRAGLRRNMQLADNITDAEGWLGAAGTALGRIVSQLEQAFELVIRAGNGPHDQNARDAIASEIDRLRTAIIGVANTNRANRPLFGGTTRGPRAYEASGHFVGTASAVERTIEPGVRVQIDVNGTTAFGPPGNDLFTTLAQIAQAVRAGGDLGALSSRLASRLRQVRTARAEVVATHSRVEATKRRNAADATTMTDGLSDVEDVDMSQVRVDLQVQETTYQAALSGATQAIQPSLANFLQ